MPTCQLITLTVQFLFQTPVIPVEEAWGRSDGTGMAENVQTGNNTCTCDFPSVISLYKAKANTVSSPRYLPRFGIDFTLRHHLGFKRAPPLAPPFLNTRSSRILGVEALRSETEVGNKMSRLVTLIARTQAHMAQ